MTAAPSWVEKMAEGSKSSFRGAGDVWLGSDGIVQEIRRLVPRSTRKELGQFYTSEDLAERLWHPVRHTLGPESVVVDPACGAGNLLAPAASLLRTRYGALHAAKQMRGYDIDSAVIEIARGRISAVLGAPLPSRSFAVNDYLRDSAGPAVGATHLVMNPPFIRVDRPKETTWGHKRLNAAALFVTAALKAMSPGSRLIAILPDVLRSGSSYAAWRSEVGKLATQVELIDFGIFDAQTNVNVFALYAVAGGTREVEPSPNLWTKDVVARFGVISDDFNVRVGSVVPHRTPESSPSQPFLTARRASDFEAPAVVSDSRPVASRLDSGPFVVVRRTSSPQDRKRVRASLICDERPIGVENHLLVLQPKEGGLARCQDLLANLLDSRTEEFVADRIRCRHLTVGSIKEIPWWEARGNDAKHPIFD